MSIIRFSQQRLRAGVRFTGVVLHYTACAMAITIDLLVFLWNVSRVTFGEGVPSADEWWPVYWVTVLGILLIELLYRPPPRLTAGLGFLSLLGLSLWIALVVLVHVAL